MLKLVSDNVILREIFWELKNYVEKIATDKYLFIFDRKINIFTISINSFWIICFLYCSKNVVLKFIILLNLNH